MTTPHSPIVTIPSGYSRRVEHNRPLLTLSLIPPWEFRGPLRHSPDNNPYGYSPNNPAWCGYPTIRSVWVVTHNWHEPVSCRQVTLNGRIQLWKRTPRVRIPWRYGFYRTRHVAYGYFYSPDGDTWDPSSCAPYRLLSIFDPLHPTDPACTFSLAR